MRRIQNPKSIDQLIYLAVSEATDVEACSLSGSASQRDVMAVESFNSRGRTEALLWWNRIKISLKWDPFEYFFSVEIL